MRAVVWEAPTKVGVQTVPDPQILSSRDAIIKVTSTAICGSDLHLVDGYIPSVVPGDVLGHEFMGEVVELGADVKNLRVGDRVVVPFPIACGACRPCKRGLTSLCENSNPNAGQAEKLLGHSPSGIFGYSHMLGGYQGGQAEYVRVPFADVGPMKIEDDLTDEQVLFLTDILPTGYMGADLCDIQPGDTVAVWGAGPVGQFAVASAYLLGAEKVIAIDRVPERLAMAEDKGGAHPLNYEEVSVLRELRELTAGRGPDHVIDAVGMEAHTDVTPLHVYEKAKQVAKVETERPHALREAILSVANGGTVSIMGVYGGMMDKFPIAR
ncbi:zinc-dependent alcohol dehydrogenase [Nocardioides pakistanensis]